MKTAALLATLLLALPLVPLRAESLPPDVEWTTNMDDPPIGSPDALRGGKIRDVMMGFPKTFRLYGPNANGAFANWLRAYSLDIGLVGRHPTTDNHIPILASHWAVMPDNRTVYYKLNEDATWSDGTPITAGDYVYTLEVWTDPRLTDPFYPQYAEDYIAEVVAIDDLTLKVVGQRESWRPLDEFGVPPTPRHAFTLSDTWIEDQNYTAPVVQGPYVISDYRVGETVTFTRLDDWWGDGFHYFTGMYNVDEIELFVLSDPERVIDFLRRGQVSFVSVNSARQWAEDTDFEEVRKGYIRRVQVFNEQPEGVSGIAMNLQQPIFQNRAFRRALQHLFNFELLNEKLMYNAYYRKTSFFEGTEYANREMEPHGFDPRVAGRFLREAGFSRRGNDGILLNPETNQRASFTLTFASPSFQRHLTTLQNMYQRAGVEMNLQLLEPSAMFENVREKAFQACTISMTSSFFPAPHQYFSSEFANKPQTNNFWNFSDPRADELIDIYRFDMDKQARLDAMAELDALLNDEAFHIHFWSAPYMRILHWDYVRWPEFYVPKRAQTLIEYPVYWIDPEAQARLDAAMEAGEPLAGGPPEILDPYGTKARLDEQATAGGG